MYCNNFNAGIDRLVGRSEFIKGRGFLSVEGFA